MIQSAMKVKYDRQEKYDSRAEVEVEQNSVCKSSIMLARLQGLD